MYRKRFLLVVVATMFGLAGSELLVRFLAIAPELKSLSVGGDECVYRRSDNPILGFELEPNFRNSNPDYIATYERINAHGQRDAERSIEKPKDVERVLVLGDSVVEGYGLAESDTISAHLQQTFDSAGESVEVLNFGVSAYCTRAEIELLEKRGIPFSPDVVVLVFVENDFDDFNREAFALEERSERPRVVESLFKRSHLFRLASWELNLFQFRRSTDPAKWNSDAIGQNNVATGLKRFRELADQHEFQPLVAIWPRFEDDKIVDVHFVPEHEHLIVEALAAQNGLPSTRLSEFFARAEGAGVQSPRLRFSQGDNLHPSPEGARIAAQAIHAAWKELPEATRLQVDPSIVEKAVGTISQQVPEYSRVYIRVGNRLLGDRKFDEAIQQYELALAEDPQSWVALTNLGVAVERRGGDGSKASAVEYYRRAIRLRPDFAEAHLNLGNAIQNADAAAAQGHLIRAVQLQPKSAAAHFSLSRSLYRMNKLRAAEAGLGQVLKLAPEHRDALLLLATIQTKQQRFDEAKLTFEQLVALEPENAEALNNLAAICTALGDEAAAVKHLKAAVAADPNHPTAAKNLEKLTP